MELVAAVGGNADTAATNRPRSLLIPRLHESVTPTSSCFRSRPMPTRQYAPGTLRGRPLSPRDPFVRPPRPPECVISTITLGAGSGNQIVNNLVTEMIN